MSKPELFREQLIASGNRSEVNLIRKIDMTNVEIREIDVRDEELRADQVSPQEWADEQLRKLAEKQAQEQRQNEAAQ